MVFSWFRDRRRKELLAQPFPEAWLAYLQNNVAHYAYLSDAERKKLQDDLRILIAEKNWEGCDGLTLIDEIKVTVAGQACLLLLGLDHDYYPDVESILVYPSGYVAPMRTVGPGGIVQEGQSARLGEAWGRGMPVVISWADAYNGGRNPVDGRNVVLHEFAHKLDLEDGSANGVPELENDPQYETWAEVMSAEYHDLVERSEHGQATLLNAYGATNAAEFFAVATECFFEKSQRMEREHPRLYDVLRGFYRQDPAARITAKHGSDTP